MKRFLYENRMIAFYWAALLVWVSALKLFFGIVPDPIELAAIIIVPLSIDLIRRQKVQGFYFNIAFRAILAWWFWHLGLYGNMTLSIVLSGVLMFSIWSWKRPNKKELKPSFLSLWQRMAIIFGAIIFIAVFGRNLGAITTMDWLYTALILIGNVIIARKKIDAWFCFLTADCFGVFLFAMSGSWMYIFAEFVIATTAIKSIKTWIKERK
ncbi:MAG: nicotinamide mononucleotide transporter family protein [Rickettsiales bacterium]|jgi:nicotinamide mononucleotide transporter|nr:nicotinamide mononucleotide transporter family protein [Rickettsiales bacterium]